MAITIKLFSKIKPILSFPRAHTLTLRSFSVVPEAVAERTTAEQEVAAVEKLIADKRAEVVALDERIADAWDSAETSISEARQAADTRKAAETWLTDAQKAMEACIAHVRVAIEDRKVIEGQITEALATAEARRAVEAGITGAREVAEARRTVEAGITEGRAAAKNACLGSRQFLNNFVTIGMLRGIAVLSHLSWVRKMGFWTTCGRSRVLL